ncbi:MAG: hypothetical protein SF162_00445 [bacterium]|nr:hypothetical protein [bacterium]
MGLGGTEKAGALNLKALTTERAMGIITFALLFALAARIPIDTDTWWHIRSGEYILQNGVIYADPFSHTAFGQAWIDHSWGAQILLYGIWQVGGLFGLMLYTAGLATLGLYFVWKASAGNHYVRAFALIFGAAAAAVFWSPRPHMLSFALSGLVLYLIHLYKREGVDRLWLIPILLALWGNLHAGFSIGFIFLVGTIGGETAAVLFNPKGEHTLTPRQIGKLALITVISAAALVINPYGAQMLAVPFQTVGIGVLRQYIQEWNSPNFQERQTWGFILLAIAVFGAAGASKRRLDWTDFALVSGTGFLALLAGRNIAVFAVAATPVLTYHLHSITQERGFLVRTAQTVSPRLARLNLALVAIIVFAAAGKAILVMEPITVQQVIDSTLPRRAVEYMRENPPEGRMFNAYNWGGYLMYALPQYPVFVDGRTDLYGDTVLREYLDAALGGASWREVLAKYAIDFVLVETGSGLANRLNDEPGWRAAYTDEQASLFINETSPS